MTPKEFYENLEEKKPFTELTSTGISDNLQNVFEFAKMYAEAINYTRCCETFFCNNKRSKEGRCVEQCGVCSEYASR